MENKDMDFTVCLVRMHTAQCYPSSTELVQCSNFCTEQVRTLQSNKK
jgi:hypothetical protein